MSTIDPRNRGRQRRALIGLALLFFAPVALAFILYYGIGWRPGGRVNHGDLVEPPVPLPDLALPRVDEPRAEGAGAAVPADAAATLSNLKGKWTLLYLGPGSCSAGCRTELYNTRQVRSALGADRERVQRVFLAEGACCDFDWLREQQPDLITVRASAAAAPLTTILERARRGRRRDRRCVSCRSPRESDDVLCPDARPKGMLEDLKKLLRLSHVG